MPIDTHHSGNPAILSSILFSAAETIHIRSEVISIISSIVEDVDLKYQLQQIMNQHHTLKRLEATSVQTQNALEEYKVKFEATTRPKLELADSFSRQLWKLELALENFEEITRGYKEKAKLYDDIVQLWKTRSSTVEENEHVIDFLRKAILYPCIDADDAYPKDVQLHQKYSIEESKIDVTPAWTTAEGSFSTSVAASTFDSEHSVIGQNQRLEIKLLETIPDRVLMRIFNFMTAYDILNFAQTSMGNYSKVDRLFGLADDQNLNEPTSANSIVNNTKPLISTQEIYSEACHESTTNSQPEDSHHSSPEINHATNTEKIDYTTVDVPSISSMMAPNITHGDSKSQIQDTNKGIRGFPLSHVLTLIPSVDKSSLTDLIKSKIGGKKTDSDISDPLSCVQNSLLSKLTPLELSAIISLREERQKSVSANQHLLAENNKLRMELDEFEPMKKFLLDKVGIMEVTLRKKNDELNALRDEMYSDKEVIAFLDMRVHELEKKNKVLQDERTQAIETADTMKKATLKQLAVMEDMLKFERENLEENEKQWKATKKLLVKEIKNVRAQALTLKAERDASSEQMMKYREALLQLSK